MPARRRPLLLGLLALVVVVAGAEVGARALAARLPEPSPWADQAQAVKAAQMDRLADEEGCVDLVVAGDSMARDGFDPDAFTEADDGRRRAYNASLDAAGPGLLRPWLLDQVVPRLRPATVVLAVSSIDLNRNGAATGAAVDAYTSSLAGRTDLLGRLDRWASDHVALVAHRRALRDPQVVLDALTDEASPTTTAVDASGRPVLPGVLGGAGQGLSRRDLRSSGAGPSAAFTRQLLADYELGAEPATVIIELIEQLRAEDVSVALLVLPVTDGFAELHPNGRADLDAARQIVVEAAEATGAPLVDLLDAGWPDDAFADTHHLNGTGADRLSRSLPGLLDEAGVPLRSCTPPSP